MTEPTTAAVAVGVWLPSSPSHVCESAACWHIGVVLALMSGTELLRVQCPSKGMSEYDCGECPVRKPHLCRHLWFYVFMET
jgi:hypothetical protein